MPTQVLTKCPTCGKTAKTHNSHTNKEGVKVRYHICRHCGTRCKSHDHKVVLVGPDLRKGENHPNARMTEEKVRQARQLHAEGWSTYYVAAAFDIEQKTAYNIVKRISWKHVE